MAYTKVEYNPVNWKNKSEGLITPLDKRNLNNMDDTIKMLADSLDVAYNELDVKKLDAGDGYKIITEMPTWDEKTGILKFRFYDGTEFAVDFNVEKIPVSFSMDEKGTITMVTEDGTEWTADVGTLTPNYVYDESERIAVTTEKSEDGFTHVKLDLKKGSITDDFLANDYLSSIIAETLKAQAAASDAKGYADNASQSASNADYDAKLAQSYAVGESGVRDGEDTDNAKYYKGQASDAMADAESARDDAKLYADRASSSASKAMSNASSANDSANSANASANSASASAESASASAASASASEKNASASATSASASEKSASESKTSASESATSASTSANNASVSATSAAGSASSASTSATNASASEKNASASATSAAGSATNASASEANAKTYYEQTKAISESFAGTLRPKGTVTFANLPSVASAKAGDMYNVSDEFTTTADFAEGAGNVIPLGSNVYKNSDGKWDVLAGSPVTGVKGSAETTYRRGNVNITKENIGLDKVENTADSEKKVSHASTANSADSAGKATNDSLNQTISATYVKGVSITDHTLSVEKGDGKKTTYTIPDNNTDTNTTYTLTQDANDGHKLTFKGTDGTTTNITIPDNDTKYDINTMIGGLSEADSTPTDSNYLVSQSGTDKAYKRTPFSKILDYLKSKFSYNDLKDKPTIGNGKVTIKQNGTEKASFSMNQTGSTTVELTDTNTNTWRDVVDGLTSDRTDASLSAKQGKVLNNSKLPHTQITTATDFNTLTSTGIYHIKVTGCANSPASKNHGTLYMDGSVGTVYQIFMSDVEVDRMYKRVYNSSSGWTGWRTLYFTDTNTTYSTATESTSGLTKLYTSTGTATDGTMTQNAITSALGGKQDTGYYTTAALCTGTIDDLYSQRSGTSGGVGSISLIKKSSGVGSSIPGGWYNYFYSPHRTGIGDDNPAYATIILTPMTFSGGSYIIRCSSNAVVEVKPILTSVPSASDLTASLGFGTLNTSYGWGTVNSSNGYTVRWGSDQAGGGGIGIGEKSGKTSIQIDGDFYAQEGKKRLAYIDEVNNLSDVSYQRRSIIDQTVDWNTIHEVGCYKFQSNSGWGDASKLHSPNAYNGDLYPYGLIIVHAATSSDTRKRLVQIYIPHIIGNAANNKALVRYHNSSSWGDGWGDWKPLAAGLSWGELFDKPTTFTPSSHKQAYTASECSDYTSDDNTLGLTPAAVKKAFTIFEPKAHTHNYLPLSGGTMSGNIEFTNTESGYFSIGGTIGNNDYWRVGGGATGANAGYLEIATADDGNEPIYVRQYSSGKFGTLARTATLLDGSGNTVFPGTVTAASFNGVINGSSDIYEDGSKLSDKYMQFRDGQGFAICTGNGKYQYFKVATLTITSNYANYPITFEFSGRGVTTTHVTVMFNSSTTTDPSLQYFLTDEAYNFYIKKTDTSTWELYGQYSETWGSMELHRIVGQGAAMIPITVSMRSIESLPDGCTQVIPTGNVNYANLANTLYTPDGNGIKQGTTFHYVGKDTQPPWLWGQDDRYNAYLYNPSTMTVGYANYVYSTDDGGNKRGMNFHWSGKSGQPTWLWGGENGSDMYVYNPSNFSVEKSRTVQGSYTANGGQQNPNYFGTNKVGFLMMNTEINGDKNYKDFMIMDCYNGNDVGGATALGIDRQTMRAFIMGSEATRTSWDRSAELITSANIGSQSVSHASSAGTADNAGNATNWAGYANDIANVYDAADAWILTVSGKTIKHRKSTDFATAAHTHSVIVSKGTHAETASGTTANSPSQGMADDTRGMYMTEQYLDSTTPTSFGNIINLRGAGTGQLLCGWSGADSTTEHIYYRSHRDTSTGGWGAWQTVAYTSDIPTNTNQLTNGAGYITGITKDMVTAALGYTPPRIRSSIFSGTMGTSAGDGGRIGSASFGISTEDSGASVRILNFESNYSLTQCGDAKTSGTTVTVVVHSDTITSGSPSFGGRVLYVVGV